MPGVSPTLPALRSPFSALTMRRASAPSRRTILGLPVFQFGVAVQVLIAIAPAVVLLTLGKPYLAGKSFWLLFFLMQGRLALLSKKYEMLCLALGCTPAIALLRDYATYNIIVVLFFGLLSFFFMKAPALFMQRIRRHVMIIGICAFATVWYLGSFYNTRDYSSNLRLFELVFTVTSVLLIGHNRLLLGAALLGLNLAAILVGAAMLPYYSSEAVARLGVITIDGVHLGNPTQLGIPLALCFLALVIDGGTWMNLKGKFYWRWPLLAPTFGLLALTTSRASWFVTALGIAAALVLGHRQRLRLLLLIGAGFFGIQLVLLSPYGHSFDLGLKRTFSEERTAAQRTSGRSDQWLVTYYACTRSLNTIVAGYGPGRGPDIYAELSDEVEGVNYAVGRRVALHSLFMQVAVESGLLGLVLLVSWLIYVFFRSLVWSLKNRLIFPFVCFLSYSFIVVTVSGNDVPSATFLGTGLLTTGQVVRHRRGAPSPGKRGFARCQNAGLSRPSIT